MAQRNDGGPANPLYDTEPRGLTWLDQGLTKRDYFAAKAMQGLIASDDEGAGDRIGDIPEYAYAIADAMLEQREN